MNRFILRVFTLFLACSALTGGAVLAGSARQEANALQDLGFAVCNDRPCWQGVTPGQTAWTITQAVMASISDISGPDRNANIMAYEAMWDGQHFFARKAQYNTLVEQIGVVGQRGTLKDVLAIYGPPCAVNLHFNPGELQLFYPRLIVHVKIIGDAMNINSPVVTVELVEPAIAVELPPSGLCVSSQEFGHVVVRWSGFASLRRYASK